MAVTIPQFTWPGIDATAAADGAKLAATLNGRMRLLQQILQIIGANLGGGAAPVSSVFTRTGAITAQSGDYTYSQVTGAAPVGVTVTKPAALTASFTVTSAMVGYIYLDPNGANRTVSLPAHVTQAGNQPWFVIRNISTGAFSLTVVDALAVTQATITAGMTNMFVDDTSIWQLH